MVYTRASQLHRNGENLAIILTAANWRALKDLHTPLLKATHSQYRIRFISGMAIVIGLIPTVWILLQNPGPTGTLLKTISALVAATLIYLTVKHRVWGKPIVDSGNHAYPCT